MWSRITGRNTTFPGSKYKYDPITVNYLKTLLENRRLPQLKKMIDNFENFYRAEKGQMMCQVTSVAELSAAQKTKVRRTMGLRLSWWPPRQCWSRRTW